MQERCFGVLSRDRIRDLSWRKNKFIYRRFDRTHHISQKKEYPIFRLKELYVGVCNCVPLHVSVWSAQLWWQNPNIHSKYRDKKSFVSCALFNWIVTKFSVNVQWTNYAVINTISKRRMPSFVPSKSISTHSQLWSPTSTSILLHHKWSFSPFDYASK